MPALHPQRLAVIDIGTNSVKLLVADVHGTSVKPVAFRRQTPRIGAGIRRKRTMGRRAVRSLALIVRLFERAARRAGAVKTVAISTWALRHAKNASAVLRSIERDTGVRVHVISGAEEARFAYLSARNHAARNVPWVLSFDVGGGSTELVLGRGRNVLRSTSLSLGALSLTERFLHSDPIDPVEYERLYRHVERRMARWFAATNLPAPSRLELVASGGAVTTARDMYIRGADHLALGTLKGLEALCLRLTIAQRKRLRGLPPDRADIMPAGIALVLNIMRLTNKRVARVNPGGVREGVLIHLSRSGLEW